MQFFLQIAEFLNFVLKLFLFVIKIYHTESLSIPQTHTILMVLKLVNCEDFSLGDFTYRAKLSEEKWLLNVILLEYWHLSACLRKSLEVLFA